MRLGLLLPLLSVVLISLAYHPVAAVYNTTSWNFDTGRSFLTLSYAAYCPKSDIRSWSCTWCNNDTNGASFRSVGFASDLRTDGFAYIAASAPLKTSTIDARTRANQYRSNIERYRVRLSSFDGCMAVARV